MMKQYLVNVICLSLNNIFFRVGAFPHCEVSKRSRIGRKAELGGRRSGVPEKRDLQAGWRDLGSPRRQISER